jgi:anaerobic selenocysteine-containing dehydrogenase
LFAHPQDLADRGLANGDRIDIAAAFDDTGQRVVRGFTVVERDIPRGCVAAYYPETNAVISLADHDLRSGTHAYKSAPVRLSASEA